MAFNFGEESRPILVYTLYTCRCHKCCDYCFVHV